MSTADIVYQSLRQRLIGRGFEQGVRLKETALAAEFGVSRTPLRQALHRLVAEGWLEQAPNQGVRVKRWTVQDVEDIFDVRLLLEPHAAAAAARRRSTDHVARLQQAAHDVAECAGGSDEQTLARRSEANARFHDTLLDAAGNARLTAILAGVVEFSMVAWTYRSFDEADVRRSCAHHFEILEAIRAGDAAWAQAVMTAHIAAARQVVLDQFAPQEKTQRIHGKGM